MGVEFVAFAKTSNVIPKPVPTRLSEGRWRYSGLSPDVRKSKTAVASYCCGCPFKAADIAPEPKSPGIRIALETTRPGVRLTDAMLPPTVAFANALAAPPPGANAVVSTSTFDFRALAEAEADPPRPGLGPRTPPAPPYATALLSTVPAPPPIAELVALATPPPPAWPGMQACLQTVGSPPRPPFPPVEVAVAEAEPVLFNAVADEVADPPWPPAPGG